MNTRAIFLGSFNPPHRGHVNCLKSVINSGLMKELNIDKIHIIPCYQNPNKEQFGDSELIFWQRYKLCTLEFAGLAEFIVVDDLEIIINKTDCNKSYTYNLINYFKGGHDALIKSNFWWIITHETYQELKEGKWKNSKELLENNRFIIVVPEDKVTEYLINEGTSQFRKIIKLENMEYSDMHSTQLREMIKNDDENVRKYMKFETWTEIKDKKMYKE